MKKTRLTEILKALPTETWHAETVSIQPIRDDDDLWYATVECRLYPEQEDYVNPAGFSIGRAWLDPENNLPCIIRNSQGRRIGYIILRTWIAPGERAYSCFPQNGTMRKPSGYISPWAFSKRRKWTGMIMSSACKPKTSPPWAWPSAPLLPWEGGGVTMAIKYTPKAELSDFLLSISFYHTALWPSNWELYSSA